MGRVDDHGRKDVLMLCAAGAEDQVASIDERLILGGSQIQDGMMQVEATNEYTVTPPSTHGCNLKRVWEGDDLRPILVFYMDVISIGMMVHTHKESSQYYEQAKRVFLTRARINELEGIP